VSRLRPYLIGSLVAVAGLVGLNGIAYSATGSGLILGHHNSADRTTSISRTTRGPALALHVKRHQVPFSVNSKRRVPRLNASLLDGVNAHSLQTRDRQFSLPVSSTPSSTVTYRLPGLTPGTYYASFDVVGRMSTAGDLLNCVLEQTDATSELLGYGSPFVTYSTTTAGGVVAVATGHPLQLRCFTSGGTYTTIASTRSIVDFVKIDGAVVQGATPAIAHARVPAHRNAIGR
jgi:hypothetical protein